MILFIQNYGVVKKKAGSKYNIVNTKIKTINTRAVISMYNTRRFAPVVCLHRPVHHRQHRVGSVCVCVVFPYALVFINEEVQLHV